MTIRIDVRDEVIDRLQNAITSSTVGVPTPTKRRWIPGQKLHAGDPRMAVYFDSETLNNGQGGTRSAINNRLIAIIVQCAVAVNNPADVDDTLEPMLAHVSDVLNTHKLSGDSVIMSVTETGTKWETAQADLVYAVASVTLLVEFQTKRGNVSARS